MKLELKHLAPYLPYGLKIQGKGGRVETLGIEVGMTAKTINCAAILYYGYKPILRPLTDLTKEIEHNGERFTPKDILTTNEVGGKMVFPVNGIALFKVESEFESVPMEVAMKVLHLLLEWHFHW